MRQKQRWDDLSPRQRAVVGVVGTIEVVLTTVALIDLARRPAKLVRGPKRRWAMMCFVQPIGPITYLAFGRR